MSTEENQKLHLQATRRALTQTKENIEKSIDELTNEISRYIRAMNDYQENNLQETKEFIDNYLETQKELIISFQSAWDPYFRTNDDGMNYYYYWAAPKLMAQAYAGTTGILTYNMTAAIKFANNINENIVSFSRSKHRGTKDKTR